MARPHECLLRNLIIENEIRQDNRILDVGKFELLVLVKM